MYVYHMTIYVGVQTLLTSRFGVHYPLPTGYGLLYFLALVGATYGLAWLSFNIYESRFLALKRNFEPRWAGEPSGECAPQMEHNPLKPSAV
jgi:peptidoglycan/LPS O-acetylase OafA/YrhL